MRCVGIKQFYFRFLFHADTGFIIVGSSNSLGCDINIITLIDIVKFIEYNY